MGESHDNLNETAQKTWKRRGLFAALWAAVAGIVFHRSTQPVEAALFPINWSNDPGSLQEPFVSSPVFLGAQTNLPSSFFANVVLYMDSRGNTPASACIQAFGDGATTIYAQSTTAPALSGQSTSGTGIFGTSTSGAALYGNIPASSNANTIAIYGVNASSYKGSVAGTGGWGVVGVSRYGHGVLGATSAAGAGAVVGNAYGITGAWAGIFFGPAIVEGDFTVIGGAKSAAVPHPDGSHRRLYCLESPESWFEDFGESELACGEANVAIDPDFAAVTHLDGYHVFLTAYGDFELHVSDRASTGFRVRAKDATASGRFSWRVVAKRKDIASPRFEPVVVPPKPEMPTIPDPPATPTAPVIRRHH